MALHRGRDLSPAPGRLSPDPVPVRWFDTLGDRDFRAPYLPEFFAETARQLGLSGREDLLDLGCGMGALMFAFAPYVRTLTGIDAELPSLQLVEARAHDIGREVRVVHARVQEADEALGPFDLVTIGKAHWYMRQPATFARLERWLKPGGRILICAPEERWGGEVWERTFHLLLDRWARGPGIGGDQYVVSADFVAGSPFVEAGRVDVHGSQQIDLEHVVRRAFGYAETSRVALGAAAAAMEGDVRKIMGRFFKNGPITEKLHTAGILFKRRDDP
jgi:SAM-dependent methyltransferase